MLKLIYTSEASTTPAAEDLVELLEVARRRNHYSDVTGMLLFAHDSFLQILEGDDAAVDMIFSSIEADQRHQHLRVLARTQIFQRRFADWSMGFEELDDTMLGATLDGYQPAVHYPLADPALVPDPVAAETLLKLYSHGL